MEYAAGERELQRQRRRDRLVQPLQARVLRGEALARPFRAPRRQRAGREVEAELHFKWLSRDVASNFQALAEQVASIEDFSRPHPLSTEIAVATVKRFLPDEQSDIRLHDLVNDLVEGVVQGASGPDFSVDATMNAEELNARVRR